MWPILSDLSYTNLSEPVLTNQSYVTNLRFLADRSYLTNLRVYCIMYILYIELFYSYNTSVGISEWLQWKRCRHFHTWSWSKVSKNTHENNFYFFKSKKTYLKGQCHKIIGTFLPNPIWTGKTGSRTFCFREDIRSQSSKIACLRI